MNSQGYRYADKRQILFDEQSRFEKAEKIYFVLREKYKHELTNAILLDIGCSTGLIDQWLADKVKYIYGLDIDEAAVASAKEVEKKKENFKFVYAGGDNLPFKDEFFDVIISNIMYYLLPHEGQNKMFDEIYRCLKPGGVCYFAAPNRLLILDGKYKLPFLCWMPVWMGKWYVAMFSSIKGYNEYYKTLFGLRRMVKRRFAVQDITLEIIDNPDKYHFTTIRNTFIRYTIRLLARVGYIFMPNYIFILYK